MQLVKQEDSKDTVYPTAVIYNTSSKDRDHWVVVTFPKAIVGSFPTECGFLTDDGRKWRAVRGRTVGERVVYRVLCYSMKGREAVRGTLMPEKFFDATPFAPHPWTVDDIAELIPTLMTKGTDGFVTESYISMAPIMIDASWAHQRWLVQAKTVSGFVMYWIADLLSGDPVIDVWALPTWSDRNDPSYNKTLLNIAIKSGELFVLDFATRHGAVPPSKDATGKWITILNSTPMSFSDGSALPLSGAMLSYVKPGSKLGAAQDPHDPNDPVNRSFANLVAATEGPVLGVCEQWDGHFCANGDLPRFDLRAIPNLMRQKDADMAAFDNSLSQYAGWYTQRPLGARKEPGGTGAQEDFGATKGTYATVFGDPRHIRGMQYSVYADFFRALCHYENDGQILRAGNHPRWTTWSGITHFNTGSSPDRLGKPGPQFSGTGWLGYDDEHHSRNNFAAYAMLSDDPLVDLLCQHELETTRASYRSRFPTLGEGASRAQGRLAGAMAQFACIDQFGSEWLTIAADRARRSLAVPTFNVAGPMKVLHVMGPDARKNVKINGVLVTSASMWEQALAAVGYYQLLKTQIRFGRPTAEIDATKEILNRISSTLKQCGYFKSVTSGQWYTVDDLAWDNGNQVPGGLVETNPAIVAFEGARGTGTWVYTGLLIARELTGSTAHLDEYLTAISGGMEATNINTGEWWAAVRNVV